MELWEKSKNEKALLYRNQEDLNPFSQWAFDKYQYSPLGWVKIGRTTYHSSRDISLTSLARLGYIKAKNQLDLDAGDLLSL